MEIVELFAQEMEAVGGKVYLLDDLEQARRQLRDLLAGSPGNPVCWKTPLVEQIYPGGTFLAGLPTENAKALCLAAGMGITEADHALAETGTLVLESGVGRSRMVSLLPPVHAAVLPASRIRKDLNQLVEYYRARPGGAGIADLSCLTLITGPSRTADIELMLTLGVHGPQAVHVLILRNL